MGMVALEICGMPNRKGAACRRSLPCPYHGLDGADADRALDAAAAGSATPFRRASLTAAGACPHCGAAGPAIAPERWCGLQQSMCRVCGWRGAAHTGELAGQIFI